MSKMQSRSELSNFLDKLVLITDLKEGGSVFYNPNNGDVHNLSQQAVAKAVGKQKWATFASKARFGVFIYEPFLPRCRNVAEKIPSFNTYTYPSWRVMRRDIDEIPELYRMFFTHIVGGDMPSYEYLLDWLANSLKQKNQTILCAIAGEGTGKGTLGEIMELLHGSSNFAKVRDTAFKKEFNGALINKTLVYVNEASITNKEALDRLKGAFNGCNWSSYCLYSNSFDAIKFGSDDRLFSILETTDKPLKYDKYLTTHRKELVSADNIQLLGWYLLNREINRDMLTPYKSKRAEKIREGGLEDWGHH